MASILMHPGAVRAGQKEVAGEQPRLKKVEETVTFLGVQMQDLDETGAAQHGYPHQSGVLIIDVVAGSPAEKAGLRRGDIIHLFAGEAVRDGAQLAKMVAARAPGDSVEIELYRGGGRKTLSAQLAGRSTSYVTFDLEHSPPYVHLGERGLLGRMIRIGGDGGRWSIVRDRARLGLNLHELGEDLALYFKVEPGEGMLVLEVLGGSAAARAGIKAGDVIVMIDGYGVPDLDAVFAALDRAEGREKVAVTLVRRGKRIEQALEFGGKRTRPARSPAREDGGLRERQIRPIPDPAALIAGPADRTAQIEQKIEELQREIENLRRQLELLGRQD